jgi:hypothetical protein
MGLRAGDLNGLVLDIFEVDNFQSKMGDDRDVCVVSFISKERAPARDMMEFIEKGYSFVLDSDVSSGEDRDGNYHVFVELERNNQLTRNIKELTDGLTKLCGCEEWKFKHYKNNKPLSLESLDEVITKSPIEYDTMMENIRVESINKFFSKTYKEEIVVEGNSITIKKPFGVDFSFNIESFGNRKDIQTDISETIKVDTKSTAEVLWLTKILGELNITKYGDEFVLENGNKAMKIKIY